MANILLIDDDAGLQEVVALALSRSGHAVDLAFSGEQGYAKALERRPDAVLLDLMLPGLNGLEVLKMFKANADLSGVPILVVSAFYGEGAFTETAVRAQGAFGFLQKPVRLQDLVELVEAAVNRPRETSGPSRAPASS